ncbi:MAG: hypothetical protein ACRD1H_14455, partial [Vicinamibacterales bacterium]
RLHQLDRGRDSPDWPALRQQLETAADQSTADEAVRRFASRVREYLDRDVLTAWASAVERGENAQDVRHRATMIGDAFYRLSGDRTYIDALRILDTFEKGGNKARLLEMAAAHREYGDGLRLFPRRVSRKPLRSFAAPRHVLPRSAVHWPCALKLR